MIENNHPLLGHNTFHLNATAQYFAEYGSVDELRNILDAHRNMPVLHIGQGSNLLFTGDVRGLVLHSAVRFIETVDMTQQHIFLRVGSGVLFDDFIAYAVSRGWGGAENLSYIPGEVGASAVQNIGAYGVEAKDIIQSVETLSIATLQPQTFTAAECQYDYRDSIFKNRLKNQYIVTAVVFRLDRQPHLRLDYGNVKQTLQHITDPTIADVREAVTQIRKQKLPEVSILGSAGSFFKNPLVPTKQYEQLTAQYPDMPHFDTPHGVKIPAAWLISKAGLKGKQIGGAQVYVNQPLVIVNTGNATAEDIMQLAQLVQDTVSRLFQIRINPEVNYI